VEIALLEHYCNCGKASFTQLPAQPKTIINFTPILGKCVNLKNLRPRCLVLIQENQLLSKHPHEQVPTFSVLAMQIEWIVNNG
jgi:hypothetical protein